MFHGVAIPGWEPGQALSPAGALLFRTRSEAEHFAPQAPAVAVAVRFDERRQVLRPEAAAAPTTAGAWSTPAVGNTLGGLTAFGPIPATLILPAAEVEGPAVGRPDAGDGPSLGPAAGFGGWDSLTMALLA